MKTRAPLMAKLSPIFAGFACSTCAADNVFIANAPLFGSTSSTRSPCGSCPTTTPFCSEPSLRGTATRSPGW